MPNETDASKAGQVQAAAIKKIRLLRPNERPGDALLEVATGSEKKQYFLIPGTALKDFAQKLGAFSEEMAKKPAD